MKIFIDSNIPMYAAGKEHPNKAPALKFLERVRKNEVEACSSAEVMQEILYRYSSLQRYDLAETVYDLFAQICPEIIPITIAETDRAKTLLVSNRKISARDALHAAVMLNHEIHQIATYDSGFDTIPGIQRTML